MPERLSSPPAERAPPAETREDVASAAPRASGWRPALAAALAGMLLTAPTLGLGFTLFDDALQRDLIRAHLAGERPDPWYDLFTWIAGDAEQAGFERLVGLRPWWSADDLQVRFLRPLAAASHYLDNLLWPSATWAMHLHSVLWYGLACAAAMLVCLAFEARRSTALLGGALYALDDAHIRTVAWLAQRNALMGAALGLLALHAVYGKRPARTGRGAALGVLLLVGALACSEGSVAVLGYALAYEALLARDALGARVRRLAPLLVVCALWFVAYDRLGYGARGSGAYLAPLQDAAYWQLLPSRLAQLCAHQLELPPSVVAWALPPATAAAAHRAATYGIAALAAAGLAMGFSRQNALAAPPTGVLRRPAGRRAGFWALAAVMSLVPAAAAEPHPRLLGFAGPALAMLIAHAIEGLLDLARPRPRHTRALGTALAAPLLLAHLVLAPIALATESARFEQGAAANAAELPALGPAPELSEQHLMVLFTPSLINAGAIPESRRRRGWSVPARLTIMLAGSGSVTYTRHGNERLEARGQGLLDDPLARLWRGPSRPMHAPARIRVLGYDAEVASVTDDGRPRHVRFHFPLGLDDRNLRFIAWTGERYTDIPLPPEGASLRLP